MLALLAGVALVAGFLDALAGGGGLLVIPALLLAQVPPVQAIATNKLQGSFGTLTAAVTMIKRKMVNTTDIRKPFFTALIGAIAGAAAIQFIHPGMVNITIPLALLTIALYFLWAPDPGDSDRPGKMKTTVYDHAVIPGIGFYDGAFGPGAGSLYCLSAVALAGNNLVITTAHAKVLNFASNIAALGVFVAGGKVMWWVGGVMIAGTMIGAYLGSLVIVHGGVKIIRFLIVVMSLSMLLIHIWKNYF